MNARNIFMLFLCVLTLAVILAYAYSSGNIEVEDSIAEDCGEGTFTECPHWLAYSDVSGPYCLLDGAYSGVGYCGLTSAGDWFTINTTPANVPSDSYCNVTIRMTKLSSTDADENLSVEINGLKQTVPDLGGTTDGNGNATYQFPEEFHFNGGSADVINFSLPTGADQVDFDWFEVHNCSEAGGGPAVPEFGTLSLVLSLTFVLFCSVLIHKRAQG